MFTFNENTNNDVKDALINAYENDTRIRIWYGDIETGKDWLEENDVIGTVGRSTGNRSIPLLIGSKSAYGGGSILDHCIIKIADTKSKRVLYQADNFQQTIFDIEPSNHIDYQSNVYRDNELIARFKTVEKAENWVSFMSGQRMRK